MALQTSNIPIPLTQGVDTKSDPKQVVPGKLLTLQNGYFQNPGLIRKRNGYTNLTANLLSGSAIDAANGIATFQNELNMVGHQTGTTSNSLFSYSTEETKWTAQIGAINTMTASPSSIYKSNLSQINADCAIDPITLARLFVWEDPSNSLVSYCVVDGTTGQNIVVPVVLATAARQPKVIFFSSNFVIFYNDINNPTHIVALRIPAATPSATPTSLGNVATDLSNITYDMTVSGSRLFIAYDGTATSHGPHCNYLDTSFNLGTSVLIDTHPAGSICVFGDASGRAWIAWATATTVYGIALSSSLVSITGVVTLDTIANTAALTGIIDPSLATQGLFYIEVVTSGITNIKSYYLNTAAAHGSGGVVAYNVSIVSKPFVAPSYAVVYLAVQYESATQPTMFIVRPSDVGGNQFQVLAKFAMNVAGNTGSQMLPEVSNWATGSYLTAYLTIDQLQSVSGGTGFIDNSGVMALDIAFGDTSTYTQAVEAGGNLNITCGGYLSSYDKSFIAEQNFHLCPEITSTSVNNGAGNMLAGTYSYVTTYEWVDSQGQLHQSSPSVAVQATTSGGTSTVTLTITNLTMTNKRNPTPGSAYFGFGLSPINICVYRTTAGGTVYHRVNTIATGVTNNNTSQSTQTFADSYADSVVSAQNQLYTTGGVVANTAPPAPYTTCVFKNRLMLVPQESRQQVWYTQEIVPGSPLSFSASLVQSLDARGGNINAIAQMDEKFIFFKQYHIFAMFGDGPSPNGGNNDFTSGQLISSDVGCIERRSVLLTDIGLIFQSTKGMCLLDRSLAVSYIGANAEGLLGSNTVTSAVLVPQYNQARFTLSNGTCLVYDYYVRQWMSFTNHSAIGATLFNGVHNYIDSSGVIHQETPGTYTDNGTAITLALTTGWLSLAQLQGFQRIYKVIVLGDYKSAHTLQCKVAYDFSATTSQTATASGSSVTPYQYRFLLARQKCEALQLQIQDISQSGSGESMDLSGITLEVGVKKGLIKLQSSKTLA